MSGKSSPDIEHISAVVGAEVTERAEVKMLEAGELYGDEKVVNAYGYVARRLTARQVQFMGLGGAIGTALFLGIGRALATAGPLSMLLGFIFTGAAVFGMVQSLGEMTTWLPVPGAMPTFASRYVDPALGFAIGWNGYYGYTIAICIEVAAAAVIIEYWNTSIHAAVWITIVLATIVCLNAFVVSVYGESEFWFASIKVVTIVGLIILALVIDLGGGPNHDRIGFRYWKNPGAMKPFVAEGDAGRFLGVFFGCVMAAYTYGGVESVVIAAGEAQDPRRTLPKAIRRVFWRILVFYVLGPLAVGLIVPYNDTGLVTALATDAPGSASSPWVIAINVAGISVLPSIINAVILTSAASAANACLYSSSRYLLSMAELGLAPKAFMKCSKRGVPYNGLVLTAVCTTLTYLSCGSGSEKVFIWFGNIATLVAMLSWITICGTYLRFYTALRKQGVNRDSLPFKSPFQPYLAWASVIYFGILVVFNGFYSFTPWNVETFVSTYAGIPIFVGMFLFWKIVKATKIVRPAEADIWTGKAAIDSEIWSVSNPETVVGKLWALIV